MVNNTNAAVYISSVIINVTYTLVELHVKIETFFTVLVKGGLGWGGGGGGGGKKGLEEMALIPCKLLLHDPVVVFITMYPCDGTSY